jgi:hypothetical protein
MVAWELSKGENVSGEAWPKLVRVVRVVDVEEGGDCLGVVSFLGMMLATGYVR